MKNIIKSLVLSLGVITFTTSCSDFLDQSSPSEMKTSEVFESVDNANRALNKVYADLTQGNAYGCVIPLNFSTNSDIELVDGLDETGTGNSVAANERGICNYNPTTQWSKLNQNWTIMYTLIEDANVVIEGVENSPVLKEGTASDIAKMKTYRAEAIVLRAMAYLDLIRIYGDVPMNIETTKVDGSNVYLEKTDRDIIYERLISDLKQITEDEELPWAGSGYTTEHVTLGFAHGLLARIALTYAGYSIRESQKDGYELQPTYNDPTYPTMRPGSTKRNELYQLAATHTAAVINNGTYKLNPSIENEWYLINQRTLDQSYYENMFEIAHGLNKSGEMGYTAGIRINGKTSYYGTKGNSSGKVNLTAPFFMSFKTNDLRRDITCAPYQLVEDNDGQVLETFYKDEPTKGTANMSANNPFSIFIGKWDPRKMNDEWLNAVRNSSEKIGYGINWIVMRYPDILLMYAESLFMLNNDATSTAHGIANLSPTEALKRVHRRSISEAGKSESEIQTIADAQIDDMIAANGFFETLMQERAWEFAGEAIRKFDLIRWGKLAEKIEAAKEDYRNMSAPSILYYKMQEKDKHKIDMSTICWYDEPENTKDYKAVSWWGDKSEKNLNYLENISSGLNSAIKNRHLFPIGATTVSDSRGCIQNSYGF